VDECKLLGGGDSSGVWWQVSRASPGQGPTLVHFSAQPKPFFSHLPVSPCLIDWGKSCTQRIASNVHMLSRKVDECKPLARGGRGQGGQGQGRGQGEAVQPDSFKTGVESAYGFSA